MYGFGVRWWLNRNIVARILPFLLFIAGLASGQAVAPCTDTIAIDRYVSGLAAASRELPWRKFEKRYVPKATWREVAKWTEETVDRAGVFRFRAPSAVSDHVVR